jgi:hypothetical protein
MNCYPILLILLLLVLIFKIPDILAFWNSESTNSKNYKYVKRTYNQNSDFVKEIQQLERSGIKATANNRKLFEKYYNGIDTKYDIKGKRIPGVAPDPERAINHLTLLINSEEGNNDDVLQLAEIYHQGMHNLEPRIDVALEIYTDILNNIGNSEIREKAQEGINDINKIKALRWLNLPPDHNPYRDPVRDPIVAEALNEPVIIDLIHDDEFNINLAIQLNNDANRNNLTNIVDPIDSKPKRRTKKHNDTQNTHDSQVLSTIRTSLKKLKETTALNISEAETVYQVRNYLQSKPDNDKLKDAIKSLDKISSNPDILSNSGMTETEGLQLVWNRIHDPIHKENISNLKDTLFNELSEMQVHGMSVCSTGRFDRIIDTLNVVDPVVNIKPTHVINEEMMNTSAMIRTKLLESSGNNRSKLEMGTAHNQSEFDQKLKEEIINTLTKDYVDTEILTPKQFKNELDKWIEHI